MSPIAKWYLVFAVIMLVPFNLYSYGEIYTHQKIMLKQECLDTYIEMTYNELQKEDYDKAKMLAFSLWYMDECSDFDYTEKEFMDRVYQLTGGIYPK